MMVLRTRWKKREEQKKQIQTLTKKDQLRFCLGYIDGSTTTGPMATQPTLAGSVAVIACDGGGCRNELERSFVDVPR